MGVVVCANLASWQLLSEDKIYHIMCILICINVNVYWDDVNGRARQLLAQKREEKAQEAVEKAKHEELERRKLGQDVGKLKQWKEEREKKEFENSYKKQKEEDRLAREKVRADLEQDRSATRNVCIF